MMMIATRCLSDYTGLDFLLCSASDTEVGLGDFAQGVRVGPGARMPRLPALFKPKKRWRLAVQSGYLEGQQDSDATWCLHFFLGGGTLGESAGGSQRPGYTWTGLTYGRVGSVDEMS